jgi:hypothetical protein
MLTPSRSSISSFMSVVAVAAFSLAGPVFASDVAVGMNLVNPYKLGEAELVHTLGDLKAAGVRVVRASITPDDRGVEFADRVSKQGIQIEWLIYRFGGYEPGGPPLSAADPEKFRKSFAPLLARLEEKGIILAAFELGNEINLAGYNSDFPHPGEQMQFNLQALHNDREAQQVATGYLQYLKLLAELKELRDHSALNKNTPILTAGLAVYESDEGRLAAGAKNDLVSANATLDYLRANGLDKLVDGYAVHVYPHGDGPGDPKAAERRRERLAKYVLKSCRPPGSVEGKPCWLTEWGFNNPVETCPLNDGNRAKLVQEMMNNLRPFVKQQRLAGLFYYSWNTDSPLAVYRCGKVTASGMLAVDVDLLR